MTQLGELQDALTAFQAAGIKLYAISYDEPDALAAFAKAHGIEYPLLSDADSALITRYGILNTLIEAGEVPFYGIPFPGTYVVDESGVVVEKFFPRHLANRESAETVLDSALGRVLMSEEEAPATYEDDDVRITAFLRGGKGTLKAGPVRRLIVRFELREGLHIYGEPVPEGMVATAVRVNGPEGLVVEDPVFPPTRTLRLEGSGVELQIFEGTVDIALPVWANSKLVSLVQPLEQTSARLDVTVRYQACDERTCLVPRTERLVVEVPIEPLTVPNLPQLNSAGQTLTPMDSLPHMKKLVRRQKQKLELGDGPESELLGATRSGRTA